jgi:hypothetical protein
VAGGGKRVGGGYIKKMIAVILSKYFSRFITCM